jgi:hypothetical protein
MYSGEARAGAQGYDNHWHSSGEKGPGRLHGSRAWIWGKVLQAGGKPSLQASVTTHGELETTILSKRIPGEWRVLYP